MVLVKPALQRHDRGQIPLSSTINFGSAPIERVRAFVIGNNSRVGTAARNEPVDSRSTVEIIAHCTYACTTV